MSSPSVFFITRHPHVAIIVHTSNLRLSLPVAGWLVQASPVPQHSDVAGLQANYNTAPKPFAPGGGGGGGVPLAVNKQYNTPIHMYSVDNVMDSLSGQTNALNIGG